MYNISKDDIKQQLIIIMIIIITCICMYVTQCLGKKNTETENLGKLSISNQ